jgi:hypothetical protein
MMASYLALFLVLASAIAIATCAPLQPGLAANVKSDLILVNRNNVGTGVSRIRRKPDVPTGEQMYLRTETTMILMGLIHLPNLLVKILIDN